MGNDQKTVVVIGGGTYGVRVAQHLAKSYNHKVCLISNLEYYYFLVSTPRALNYDTPSDWVKQITLPLKEILPENINLVIDDVTNIDNNKVSLRGHKDIAYDALVIATGARWPSPVFPEFNGNRTIKGLQDYYESIVKAMDSSKRIVFVGAGFVGLEIVGELAHKYREEIRMGEKSITIYHGNKELLDFTYGEKLKKGAEKDLEGQGVKFVFDTRVISDGNGGGIFEKTGENVLADKIYFTTGPVANPPPNSISDLVDDLNQVKIDTAFRAIGADNGKIFALGDVTDWPRRVAQNAKPFPRILAHNINSFLEGKTDIKHVPQPSGYAKVALSLGPENAYGQWPVPFLGYINFPKSMVVKVKARKMLSDVMLDFAKI
ncbi:unnamed protein product [Kuraishia capsulata CBS 1993]|uniref:FAD/NAD(P)-binding domain-containing protein n=1 Tax=Kuraishia capsulata CBS 1993 TaxID=1382522 RepID=W6MJ15_9ASCO|nr:uncharacterized protein KUCA_T00001914001 [Kuraishia capsulata CBS 1993]CDK25943.1 unnamed protein product [Kuraishia capsulata CBS 1993]